jgi:pimeloyl-ACP methyl ester carboxylesterase
LNSAAGATREYFYSDVGSGIPLLLFHGFPFTHESFWPQLERPPKGLRILAPDHQGFGRSASATTPVSIEAMAQDGLHLLDALNISSALVGGVSMGGYVSMALTHLKPQRVKGLFLIDTQAEADDDAQRARRESIARTCEVEGTQSLIESLLEKFFAPSTSSDVRRRLEELMRAQNPQAVAQASLAVAHRIDAQPVLSRFVGKSLVMVGEHDVVTPVSSAKTMHRCLTGSRLAIIKDAGHLPQLEQPESFNETIERFVAHYF